MSQPIYSATQTTLTNNLDIPIQQAPHAPPIWVNIANNTIQGETSGTTVIIYPDGSGNGTPVGYGASQSIQVGNPRWIRISGVGANITLIVGHEEIVIRSTIVQNNQFSSNPLLPGTTYLMEITAPFTGNIPGPTVPAGFKWIIDAIGILINGSPSFSISEMELQLYMPTKVMSNPSWFLEAFNDTTVRTMGTGGGFGFWWWLPNVPQNMGTPTVNVSNVAWDLAYYSSNTGPASGDTTIVTKPLVLYAGSQITLYVDVTDAGEDDYVWLALLGEQVPL